MRVLRLELREQALREGEQRVEVIELSVVHGRPSNPGLQVSLYALVD